MEDNNNNIIKPVESLQNITGIAAAKRREERKKRQTPHEQKDAQLDITEDELNESVEEEDIGSEIAENDQNEHSIDYRA